MARARAATPVVVELAIVGAIAGVFLLVNWAAAYALAAVYAAVTLVYCYRVHDDIERRPFVLAYLAVSVALPLVCIANAGLPWLQVHQQPVLGGSGRISFGFLMMVALSVSSALESTRSQVGKARAFQRHEAR